MSCAYDLGLRRVDPKSASLSVGGEVASKRYWPGEMPRLAVLAFVLRMYLLPLIFTAVCVSGRVSLVPVGDIGEVMAEIGSSSVTSG